MAMGSQPPCVVWNEAPQWSPRPNETWMESSPIQNFGPSLCQTLWVVSSLTPKVLAGLASYQRAVGKARASAPLDLLSITTIPIVFRFYRHTSSRPCTMDEMSEEVGAAGYASAAEAGASQPATSGEWNSSFGASMRR
jgi:hypothetical protein